MCAARDVRCRAIRLSVDCCQCYLEACVCAARDVRSRAIRLSVDSVASVISRLVCAQLVMYDAIRLSVDSVASVISRLVCAQLVLYDAEPFVCLLTLLPVLSRGLYVRSSCCTMQSHSSVC